MHLASTILGTAHELLHSKGTGWWKAIGLELRVIEEVGHALCHAADARQHLTSTAAEPAER